MTKKIAAVIREEKLNDVKDALRQIGVSGLNVAEVRGHGRQGGIELNGRAGTYKVDLLPKIQLNIILSDDNVEKTFESICRGDGLIFVYPVEEVVRIRTVERGREVLACEGDSDGRLPGSVDEDVSVSQHRGRPASSLPACPPSAIILHAAHQQCNVTPIA